MASIYSIENLTIKVTLQVDQYQLVEGCNAGDKETVEFVC